MANEKRLIDYDMTRDATYEEVFWTESEQATVRHFLAKIPKVDAVEVVHGRWIGERCAHKPHRIKNPEKWLVFKCSVCGYSNGRKQSNYCPNCGAKMDGDGNDTLD